MTNGPSPHLSWKELACKDGTPYPFEWRDNRAIQLAEIFEMIRSSFGSRPIKILSAYRTPSHNKKVGGARNSQHLHGRALDLKPPDDVSIQDLHRFIIDKARSTMIRGIGKYKTFIHIDIRPTDNIVKWSGSGVRDGN